MSLKLNRRLRRAIFVNNFRLTLENPKLKILLHTRVLTFYLEREKKPVKNETFRQSSTWPSMLFLNIKMAGWGRNHKWIKMLVSSDCLCPESWNNYLPERNRRLIIFMAKKNNIYLLYVHFICSLWKGSKFAPSNYTPSIFVRNLGDRLFSGK